jgi:hypothetical protein
MFTERPAGPSRHYRWLWIGFFLLAAMMETTRGHPTPSTSVKPYDPCNPLWCEDYVYTGQRRGPRCKDAFSQTSPPVLGRRRPRDDSVLVAALKRSREQGNKYNHNSVISASSSTDGAPSLLNRWLQHRSQREAITIQLEERREES